MSATRIQSTLTTVRRMLRCARCPVARGKLRAFERRLMTQLQEREHYEKTEKRI